jgi:GNAT superfamily N-acetyltransferase
MEVRLGTARDAKGIAGVQERGWQAAYRHVFPPAELDRGGFIQVSRWRDRLRRPPTGWATFVSVRDGAVIGFACIGPSRDVDGAGEVYAIYVEPEWWSTGTGRSLMERAEQELASRYDQATLWVLEDNPRARRFYERAGWELDGARKSEERWGVCAAEVRYRRRLIRARS